MAPPRKPAPQRKPRRRKASREQLVRSARKRLETLSTPELLQVHDVLERLLNSTELEPPELAQLERLLGKTSP